jgi:hypothetical protein
VRVKDLKGRAPRADIALRTHSSFCNNTQGVVDAGCIVPRQDHCRATKIQCMAVELCLPGYMHTLNVTFRHVVLCSTPPVSGHASSHSVWCRKLTSWWSMGGPPRPDLGVDHAISCRCFKGRPAGRYWHCLVCAHVNNDAAAISPRPLNRQHITCA